MTDYDIYKKAKRDRENAEKWQSMRFAQTRDGSCFSMSAARGKMTLMRCGQYNTGGTNYWDSPEALNKAMLEVIETDNSVILAGIERLKRAESLALQKCQTFIDKCQTFIDEMQGAINADKEQK